MEAKSNAEQRQVRSGRQESGVNLATQHLPHGASDTTSKRLRVYIKTFGWPLVTVARDGAGCAKEGKWFGVRGLERIKPEDGNLINVA